MVWEDLKPSDILSHESFENAITTALALGGSTNAIIHLIALAGRAGIKIELSDFDRLSRRTPVLADVRPSGRFLMEDFYYAGGLRALLSQVTGLLHLDCVTVSGQTIGENLAGARVCNAEVIRPLEQPLAAEGGTAILFGNLAPNGAVIKASATEPRLLRHTGPAVVFEDYNDMAARIDDESLEVEEDSVLVLRNAGPLGGPGMPEWGMLPIPKKLLERGVRDMVRICDGRMSGTAYGTVVLHVSPEGAAGGPLAKVRTGDWIVLDVEARRIDVDVPDDELEARPASEAMTAALARPQRGWEKLYVETVLGAETGADLDFLVGSSGDAVARESH